MPNTNPVSRLLAATALTAMLAGTALAQTATEVSLATIAAEFEARGDRIHDIDREDSVYEIEYVTREGRRMEAAVDAVSGRILHSHPDR